MPGAPAAPAAAPKQWGPVILGLVGGLIALVGAIIPWTQVESCVSAAGIFSACVSVPLTVNIGNVNALLSIAPLLALLTSLVGIALLFLHKPMMGMVSGVMGILALVFAVLFLLTFNSSENDILNLVVGGAASASMKVGVSFGVYVTMVGGLLLAIGGFMQWGKLKGSKAAPAA